MNKLDEFDAGKAQGLAVQGWCLRNLPECASGRQGAWKSDADGPRLLSLLCAGLSLWLLLFRFLGCRGFFKSNTGGGWGQGTRLNGVVDVGGLFRKGPLLGFRKYYFSETTI
jgi:hypothetical protein